MLRSTRTLFFIISALAHLAVLLSFESTFMKPAEVLIAIQVKEQRESGTQVHQRSLKSPVLQKSPAPALEPQAASPSPHRLVNPPPSTVTSELTDSNQNEHAKLSGVDSSPANLILGSELGIEAVYPRLSRLLKESGQVVLQVNEAPEGKLETQVLVSSGYLRLDQAASEALMKAAKDSSRSRRDLISRPITFIFKLK